MLEDIIDAAIRSHILLTFTYKDELRTVEPHAFGLTAAGLPRLRAYQTQPEEGWRLFDVAKIIVPIFSDPRPGYKRGDSAMTTIIAEL